LLRFMGENSNYGGAAHLLRRLMEGLFILWLLSFIVIECVVAFGAATDPEAEGADYLIVLGAGLNGETPSLVLQSRLDEALRYLERNPETRAVLTGGQGRRETITEAEAMRRFLTASGIDEARLILEDQSTDTIQNIRFAFALIDSDGGGTEAKVAVLSSEFHVYRARYIAEKEGRPVYRVTAETPMWSMKMVYYIREYFSMMKVFLVL
ncbi:YdcF family protein, partial [Oscillospiraceae bacterium OttesenSCG-928-F05]|nr:YdcF family protein [Oscillospiraceae bacterium OttesenSCG-928-F05]